MRPVADDRRSARPARGAEGGPRRLERLAFAVPPLVALAILLVSVQTPAGPSTSTPIVPSFDGARAAEFARELAQRVPDRAPGSATAALAADDVAGAFAEATGDPPRRIAFEAPGPSGATVSMENVWFVAEGASKETIVVLAHRDDVAPGPGLDDNASGTAAVVELARDLAGVQRARTLVFAAVDGGTVGQAGAERLLADLRADGYRPVAVVALDAIANPTARLPVLIAGSGGVRTPGTVLRGLEEALDQQPGAGEHGPQGAAQQLLDLIAPASPVGAQAPFLDAGIAAVQLGDGGGGVGVEPLDDARFGAIGAAIATLLVRLDAEPRPTRPSGAYVAISGRILPGRSIALLALALLVGPLVAAGRRLARGPLSRRGWGAALLVGAIGAAPGLATVLIARLADLAGWIATPAGAPWPLADPLAVGLCASAAVLAIAAVAYLIGWRLEAPLPAASGLVLGLLAAVLLLAGSPASVRLAVPALWVWALVRRPEPIGPRLAWGLGPVLLVGLVVFLLRGADLAALVGAAGTGALPAALVVGSSALVGAGVAAIVAASPGGATRPVP
jgi:hypothetical protein